MAKRKVFVSVKAGAINCKSRNPSNKGRLPPYLINQKAYKGDNYYITIPLIDKIAINVDIPHFTKDDKKQFRGKLYEEWKRKREGLEPNSPLEKCKIYPSKKRVPRYNRYYKIHLLNCADPVHLFIYTKKNAKSFLRFEFNPHKLGRAGINSFKKWYDTQMAGHHTFKKLCETKRAITRLDVAIDVYGIHVSDLIFKNELKYKSTKWFGTDDMVETVYPRSKPGKTSSFIVYDKLREFQGKNTSHKGEADALSWNQEKLFTGEWAITRIEKHIKNPAYSLNELSKLSFDAHFSSLKIFLPLDPLKYPDAKYYWKIFLDSVRHRGLESALSLIPAKKRGLYIKAFNESLYDVLGYYTKKINWRECWNKRLEQYQFVEH